MSLEENKESVILDEVATDDGVDEESSTTPQEIDVPAEVEQAPDEMEIPAQDVGQLDEDESDDTDGSTENDESDAGCDENVGESEDMETVGDDELESEGHHDDGSLADAEDVLDAEQDAPDVEAADSVEPEKKKKGAFDDYIMDMVAIGFFSIALGLLLAFCGSLIPSSSSSSSVAATVNGEKIFESEVTQELVEAKSQMGGEDGEMPWDEWLGYIGYESASELRDAVIDNFISEKLMEQAMKEYGIEVSDEDVEAEYQSSLSDYGGEDELKQLLEMYGMSMDDYRDNISTSLSQKKLAEAVVDTSQIPEVSDDEVKEMLEQYYGMKEGDENWQEAFDSIKDQMRESALYEKFSEWMEEYKGKAEITRTEMPEGLPYDVTPKTPSYNDVLSMDDLGTDPDADDGDEGDAEDAAEAADAEEDEAVAEDAE